MRLRSILVPMILFLATGIVPSRADDPAKPAPAGDHKDAAGDKEGEAIFALLPGDAVTHHSYAGKGGKLAYTATAGTIALRDDKGQKTAEVFYVGYTLDGAPGATRPISFFFNGGPGAGAAYLHMGAAGPVAFDFPVNNETDGGGGHLEDNPDSWLPFTDMVFIDAVGTGWSRPAKPDEAQKQFYGVKQDARTFARAIALWLSHNGRIGSPKYLVGESYGGIRSLKVARALQTEESIIPAGIVMVSPAIDATMLFDAADNPLIDALRLPSFAASALERQHKFDPAKVDEAYRFALGEFLTTTAGVPPTGDTAKAFYTKVAGMIDVPADIVARRRGILDIEAPELRRHDGKISSLYDGSLLIADPFPEDGSPLPDPILEGYGRAYGGAFVSYASATLGFKTDLTYKLLALDVNKVWQWTEDGDPSRPSGSDDMRWLLALDPSLRIFIAGGYFDLVVPYAQNRWLVEHLPLGADRVGLHLYSGGHMLYTRPGSRARLTDDVSGFYGARRG